MYTIVILTLRSYNTPLCSAYKILKVLLPNTKIGQKKLNRSKIGDVRVHGNLSFFHFCFSTVKISDCFYPVDYHQERVALFIVPIYFIYKLQNFK